MKIKVVNQRLYLEPPETAEGTREYLRAEFSCSEEWDGMTKTALFRGADGENHPKLLEDAPEAVETKAKKDRTPAEKLENSMILSSHMSGVLKI